jgi:hypothetical protein
MTVEAWLRAAVADAEQRDLPELKPLLESLALATRALRAANFPHYTGDKVLDPSIGSPGVPGVAGATPPPSSPQQS